MQIIFHSHHASVSDRLRLRAEHGVRKLGTRLGGAVDAVIRFEGDGPTRRVEIVMHASRHRRLVAEGQGRYLGPALSQAIDGLRDQVDRARRIRSKGERRRAALKAPQA
ncbi:MAG: HPF/RaiA family ribosome-associated protein [Gemmatimonadaceae bacterium]